MSRPVKNPRELPHDPQYDAIYAEIVSTRHGRRFLTEYARRHDCTAPPSLVGTIARIESAFRDLAPTQVPASLIRCLVELAEAIERLEAAVAPQRIADGLQETEALLCAALDTATREINAVIASSNASDTRSLHRGALLRDVKRRVGHMVALLIAIMTPEGTSINSDASLPDVKIEAKSERPPPQVLANRDALAPLSALSEEELVALFS